MRDDQGNINHWDDGRGVYFDDPDGYPLEIITRPMGAAKRRQDIPPSDRPTRAVRTRELMRLLWSVRPA
jgi:hypothetical protein